VYEGNDRLKIVKELSDLEEMLKNIEEKAHKYTNYQ
jgi:hypothetical protein